MNKAIFLDRDGTVIEEGHYISEVEQLTLIKGAAAALKRLNEAGYLLVIVTNQAGVARGYFDEERVELLNRELGLTLSGKDIEITGFKYCPHHPEHTGPCSCRKPEPGMLLDAAKELEIDLAASWMVGDKVADIGAGVKAGCRTALVKTGYGAQAINELPEGLKPDIIADDLADFARTLLNDVTLER